ncbi:MAG: hypothetical protein GY834_01135 [Bacteroidetes bacterium]|nr:hypothetical protein [Bacteroidota bacterium]
MKAKLLCILFTISLVLVKGPSTFGQDESKFGDNPDQCKINISLYQESFRQWKEDHYKGNAIEDAITPWRWVVFNCPEARESTFQNGVRIMNYRIKKEENNELREKYIDTLLMLYDMRIQYFGNEGKNLGRKGNDYYKYRTKNFAEANAIFKRSIELEGNNSVNAVLDYYFRTTAKMVKEQVVEKSIIMDAYDQVSEIIDFNLKKFESDARMFARWKNTKGSIEAKFEPFATCEDLVEIYTKKFEQNNEDIDLLNKIISRLDKKRCVETQLYFDVTIQLYNLNPTPESAYFIGKIYLRGQDYNAALSFLQKATALEDKEELAKVHFYIAKCYQASNNKRKTRRSALKSLEYNPSNGSAYILIGDLYVASASSCGDNDLTSRVAHWAAVDKYAKAKRVDPSVTETANSRIREYSKHFPTTETIFLNNLKEGDSYLVECWINETTKIRAVK